MWYDLWGSATRRGSLRVQSLDIWSWRCLMWTLLQSPSSLHFSLPTLFLYSCLYSYCHDSSAKVVTLICERFSADCAFSTATHELLQPIQLLLHPNSAASSVSRLYRDRASEHSQAVVKVADCCRPVHACLVATVGGQSVGGNVQIDVLARRGEFTRERPGLGQQEMETNQNTYGIVVADGARAATLRFRWSNSSQNVALHPPGGPVGQHHSASLDLHLVTERRRGSGRPLLRASALVSPRP